MKYISRFLTSFFALFLASAAYAADSFDVSTNRLTLGAVQLSGTNYSNVVVDIASYTVLGVDGGTTNGISSFNPTNNQLTLGSVTVQGTTYTNARVIINSYSLVSVGAACPSPAVASSTGNCINPPAASGYSWNSVLKVWVADIGTTITSLNTLPDACLAVGDACWKASTANGTIKYISSNVVYSGRKVIFAGFIIGPNSFGAGNFNMKWVYADAEGETPAANKSPANGFSMDGFVNAKGSDIGVKYTMPSGNCGEFFFNGSGIATRFVSCPI